MSRITWDALGERIFEIGLDHGVVYFPYLDGYSNGVAWNGLTKVEEPILSRKEDPLYSGDIKVANSYISEDYTGSIEAYTYPDEFDQCIGIEEVEPGIAFTRQDASRFGLSYRTLVGSAAEGTAKGYKIHLVYNIEITGFSCSHSSINDSLDLDPLTWDFEAFPEFTDGHKPVYHIVINSGVCTKSFLKFLCDSLYGTESELPRLPMPQEILDEYYNYYDIHTGYPATLIYPRQTIYPEPIEEDLT